MVDMYGLYVSSVMLAGHHEPKIFIMDACIIACCQEHRVPLELSLVREVLTKVVSSICYCATFKGDYHIW